MGKTWLLIIPVAGALAAAAVWTNRHADETLPQGFAGANGRLELNRLDIATLYPGRVERVLVQEGDRVAQDAVLAELSSAQSRSRLAAARATVQRARQTVARAEAETTARREQLRVAQLELNNTRQLKKDTLVSGTELQKRLAARDGAAAAVKAAEAAQAEARAAVAQAEAQVEAAASADEDMQIRAPKAGRVEYRIAEAGAVLGAGNRVITLLDPTDASMSVFLNTDTIGRIRLGDEARIVLDGIDAVWPATVRFVATEAQFTPKFVETSTERARLMYRVKLAIPVDVARQYEGLLKGGLVGNGYVRTAPQAVWPSEWQIRLPDWQDDRQTP